MTLKLGCTRKYFSWIQSTGLSPVVDITSFHSNSCRSMYFIFFIHLVSGSWDLHWHRCLHEITWSNNTVSLPYCSSSALEHLSLSDHTHSSVTWSISLLDYGNATLTDIPSYQLHSVMNVTAPLNLQDTSPLLYRLHWLKHHSGSTASWPSLHTNGTHLSWWWTSQAHRHLWAAMSSSLIVCLSLSVTRHQALLYLLPSVQSAHHLRILTTSTSEGLPQWEGPSHDCQVPVQWLVLLDSLIIHSLHSNTLFQWTICGKYH